MSVFTLIVVFIASALAIAMAYSSLPTQRWWRRPLVRFPARATAILAAIVALRGWLEVLGLLQGGLAWMSTLAVPLVVLFLADARHAGSQGSHP